jgi:hypothetical protein
MEYSPYLNTTKVINSIGQLVGIARVRFSAGVRDFLFPQRSYQFWGPPRLVSNGDYEPFTRVGATRA